MVATTHSVCGVSPMSTKSERIYLERLRAHAAHTVRYLSNELKPERERSVCRAFLRSAGISFVENEIVAPSIEPGDVAFREARFQVREIMEKGRRRGDEWKQRQDRWNRAQSGDEVTEVPTCPIPMRPTELIACVADALKIKSAKYGSAQCRGIDALIYVNLTGSRFLYPASSIEDVAELEAQDWRSVCVLFPPYGLVLFARETAPGFIRRLAGKTLNEWATPDGLFDS